MASEKQMARWLRHSTVRENGCIEYNGNVNRDGYAPVRHQGTRQYLHRISFEHYKHKLDDGICALHSCDNRRCWNAEHLFAGTRTVNNEDKVKKGRQAKGSEHGLRGAEHPLARLSTQDVRNVRALYSDGEKQRVIAEKYGISQPAVSAIVNHKRWA